MKSTLLAAATLIAATALPAMLQTAAAQDVEKGQRSFNKCLPCHAIGHGAENKVGPELNGLDGRQAGAVASFSYSEANKNRICKLHILQLFEIWFLFTDVFVMACS